MPWGIIPISYKYDSSSSNMSSVLEDHDKCAAVLGLLLAMPTYAQL